MSLQELVGPTCPGDFRVHVVATTREQQNSLVVLTHFFFQPFKLVATQQCHAGTIFQVQRQERNQIVLGFLVFLTIEIHQRYGVVVLFEHGVQSIPGRRPLCGHPLLL